MSRKEDVVEFRRLSKAAKQIHKNLKDLVVGGEAEETHCSITERGISIMGFRGPMGYISLRPKEAKEIAHWILDVLELVDG